MHNKKTVKLINTSFTKGKITNYILSEKGALNLFLIKFIKNKFIFERTKKKNF